MARPLRIDIANGLYHVTARGWERRSIVDGDRDREDWLRLLDRVATQLNWRVFSWVLMSNHFSSLSAHTVGGVFIGATAWVEAMRKRLTQELEDGHVPLRKRRAWRPSATEIVQDVRRQFQVPSSVRPFAKCDATETGPRGGHLPRTASDRPNRLGDRRTIRRCESGGHLESRDAC